jgi:hypothetical protein
MNHPLIGDYKNLTDVELQEKVSNLSTKYWQTQNPEVRSQMTLILDELKEELRTRNQKSLQNNSEDDNKDLDSLIKIS